MSDNSSPSVVFAARRILRRGSLSSSFIINVAGVGVPLLIAIVTIPLYLAAIGNLRFGLISLLWLVFGYFGLLDFGLSRATAQRLAQLRNSSLRQKDAVFLTAFSINLVLGILAGIIFLCSSSVIISYFIANSEEIASEIPYSVMLAAGMFPLAMIGNVAVGRLEAEERFLSVNGVQILGAVCLQTFPLLFVYTFGARLDAAVLGAVVARSLTSLSLLSIAFPWSRVRSRRTIWFHRREASSLFKFGGWVMLSNSISPLLVSLDQFFIGAVLGAGMLPYYSVPYSMATKILVLPGALSRTIFPRMASTDEREARMLAREALSILSFMMAAVCILGIMLAKAGLSLWLGEAFAIEAVETARIIILGTWFNALAFVPLALLQSRGKANTVAKLHLCEFIPFIILLYALITVFGLVGAAYAWTIRVGVDCLLLLTASRMIKSVMIENAIYLIIVSVAIPIAFSVDAGSLAKAVITAALLFACGATFYLFRLRMRD